MWCEEDTRTHSNRSKLENITLQNLFCFRISQYTYSQCSRMTTRESDDDYFVAPLDVSCTWTLNYSTRLLMMKRWNVAYESHLLPFHILANGIIFVLVFILLRFENALVRNRSWLSDCKEWDRYSCTLHHLIRMQTNRFAWCVFFVAQFWISIAYLSFIGF